MSLKVIVSLQWDLTPSNRGASFSLRHAVGAAAGGVDALLNPTAIQVLDADAHGGQQQNTPSSSASPSSSEGNQALPGSDASL